MKTIKLLPALLITLSLVGCKENEAKNDAVGATVIEETTVDVVERSSDTHFEQALNAYENGNKPEAIKQLNEGIDALEKESKDVAGLYKTNIDASKDQLRNIAGKLDDNFDISIEGFKEAVANAEINVAHNYLATEDVYVLMPKENLKENNLNKALDQNLKSLEAGTSKLEGDAKKEGEKLSAEGRKLKEDFEAWKKRAEDHENRVEAHFKKHQPEYNTIDRVYAM